MTRNKAKRHSIKTFAPHERSIIAEYYRNRPGPRPQRELDAELDDVSRTVSLPPEPTQAQKLKRDADTLIYTYGSRPSKKGHGLRNAAIAGTAIGLGFARLLTSGGGDAPTPKAPENPAATATNTPVTAHVTVEPGQNGWEIADQYLDDAHEGDIPATAADINAQGENGVLQAHQDVVLTGPAAEARLAEQAQQDAANKQP